MRVFGLVSGGGGCGPISGYRNGNRVADQIIQQCDALIQSETTGNDHQGKDDQTQTALANARAGSGLTGSIPAVPERGRRLCDLYWPSSPLRSRRYFSLWAAWVFPGGLAGDCSFRRRSRLLRRCARRLARLRRTGELLPGPGRRAIARSRVDEEVRTGASPAAKVAMSR